MEEENLAFLTRWLATSEEATELMLDYEEQLEAVGSQVAMYQSDEGRAVILTMVDICYRLDSESTDGG